MEPPNPTTSDRCFDALDSFDHQQDETLEQEEEDSSSLSELIKTLPTDVKPQTQSNPLSLDPPPPPPLLPPPPPPPPAPSPRLRRRGQPSPLTSDRRTRTLQQLHDAASESSSTSAITLDRTVDSRDQTLESPPNGSILLSIVGFVIKAIFFQINLLLTCFGIPLKLLHFSFLMAIDPFGTVKRVKNGLEERFKWVLNAIVERIGPLVGSNQLGLGKLAGTLALGCFWSVYVGFILVGILVTAFFGGSLVMRWMVEEPLQVVRELNFDYTKPSPVAVVAVDSWGGVNCNGLVLGGKEFGKQLSTRVVPINQKLQLVVSLTMPESDYNRKLGMFQVGAEFISASGKVTHSSRQPCMLQFKSPHIRFIETFLKTGTLLAGYSSESQILSIKMTGFIEGIEPTVCVRVILEQRAEYSPGSGIPEIYAASLKLESQLPLLKKILWNWRRMVFIWVGMMLFFFELLIFLVCCRPVIIPRTRPSSETPSRT